MKKKVLVIGYSGLVGSRFVELAKSELEITSVDERVLDITNINSVKEYFENNTFDSVVNFAAITNVDGAEKERANEDGITWKLNVEGIKNLVVICKEKNIFLAQISTDFVFPGDESYPGPYSEDSPLPSNLMPSLGWYGWTKNRAEYVVRNSGGRAVIVRIAYPFYAGEFMGKLDFAKNYLKLFDEGKLFPLFTDQTMSVLNVDDLIDPFVKILTEEIEGVFHIVSKDTTTPFEFTEYLLEKTRNATGVVQKGSMEKFLKVEGRTPRPRIGGLKTEKTEEQLGIKFKSWRQMVDQFVAELCP